MATRLLKWSRSTARSISPANIPKGTYKGIDEDTPVAAATNLLIANEKLDENLAYQITKLLAGTHRRSGRRA